MPLDFPANPSVNDTYSFGGKTWIWTGEYWRINTTGAINDIPIGNVTANTGNFTTLAVQTGVASNLLPTANVTFDLGANDYRWNDLWLANSTIHIGNGSISATADGNVTIGVAGSEVAEFSTVGLDVTGNISSNYFVGNGSQLTGIATSAFDLIQVTGQANVDAATSTTLTLVAGDGISITTDAGNTTITFTNTAIESIFATGGDMGLVTQAATDEEDLGSITDAVTESYDLGSVAQQFAIEGNLAGNLIGNTHSIIDLATLSVLGDTEVGDLTVTGNVSPSANVTYDLGNTTNRWNDLWLANSTIYIGEAQISATGATLELPATVQIGNVTLSESDGNLSLPENITATTVTATGNVSGGNLTTAGLISATGNVSGGNLTTAGLISATGNITAGNLTPTNALAINFGGTGATTSANALTNLGATSIGKAIAMTIVFG